MPKVRAHNPEQRRRALREVMKRHDITANAWAKKAGVSEGTIRNFLNGGEHGSESMSDRVYSLLANSIGESVPALQGESIEAAEPRHALETVPLRSYVGAGDEIIVIPEDQGPMDWVEAPPQGAAQLEATVVRGRSGMPHYHDGDVLYHRMIDRDPARFRGEVVVAQVRNGKRYLKILEPGKRKGHYTLVSINPLYEPIEDQQLDWVGPIVWIKKRQRFS